MTLKYKSSSLFPVVHLYPLNAIYPLSLSLSMVCFVVEFGGIIYCRITGSTKILCPNPTIMDISPGILSIKSNTSQSHIIVAGRLKVSRPVLHH